MNVNETSVSDSNKILKRFDSDYVARMRQVFEERAERDRISRDNYFKKEGEIKERIKNAIALMSNGYALDGISKSLGMPREELLELARKNNITVEE